MKKVQHLKYNDLIEFARNRSLTSLCDGVFKNRNFQLWSGSGHPTHHHYGKGGLMKHTLEVWEISKGIFRMYFTSSDRHELHALFLACIYHDIGKIRDYQYVPDPSASFEHGPYTSAWVKSKHSRNIHHISRSNMIWHEHGKNSAYADEVSHAILAHHGCREYGSPIAPKSKIAWILHLADSMSARMDDYDKRDLIERDTKNND